MHTERLVHGWRQFPVWPGAFCVTPAANPAAGCTKNTLVPWRRRATLTGKRTVLKTVVRKDLWVRVPRPPLALTCTFAATHHRAVSGGDTCCHSFAIPDGS